jgi:hypothetical protein
LRIEDPVVTGHDEALDITHCSGRFILELPPGAERGFSGDRRLEARIEYSAQAAADGSGMVYSMKGADSVIGKLAAFDLKGQSYRRAEERAEERLATRSDEDMPSDVVRPSRVERTPAPRPQAAEPPPPPPAPPPPPPESRPTRTVDAANPSFNCRFARTRSERMVCGSGRLAALDRAMSARYYEALSGSDSRVRGDLRRSRDRFLAHRDRCRDEDCVAQAYRDRIDEIEDIASEN